MMSVMDFGLIILVSSQGPLPVSVHPDIPMGTGDLMLEGNPVMD